MKYLLVAFIFFIKTVQSQEIIIFDNDTNEPLQGVAVSLKNNKSNKIFFSDIIGSVNIKSFKNNDTLVFEQVGYKTLEVVKSNISLNNKVYLELKAHTLENISVSDSRVKKLSFIKTKRPTIISSQSAQIGEILEKNMGISVQHSQNGGVLT